MEIGKILMISVYLITPFLILFVFILTKRITALPKNYIAEESLIKFLKRADINDATRTTLQKAGWDDGTVNQSIKYVLLEKKLIDYIIKARMNDMSQKEIKNALISIGWDDRIICYLLRKYYV
ncbi:hypothetical protein C0585_06165 [Candidatus Woesearchaeota archaeon]|nr:MAG: hypothetical protein C0585_06165 [Candidatus Woesearchaeota archaeon]